MHQVKVAEANVEYVGSITIDRESIEKVGIRLLEEVQIWNVTNGNHLSTYVLPAEVGSGVICINGAAANLCDPGNTIIIVADEERDREEVLRDRHLARGIVADENNRVQDFICQQLIPAGDGIKFDSSTSQASRPLA